MVIIRPGMGVVRPSWSRLISLGLRRHQLASAERCSSSLAKISRFPVVEESSVSTLPEDMRRRIEEVQKKAGFMPNVHKMLAHRPAEFRAFFDYYDALMEAEGTLTKAEKEMIVVATSALNNCSYCLVAHGAVLRIYSKNPRLGDQVTINYRHAEITQRQKAMLDFALEVARGQPIEDSSIDGMKQLGFSDREIWDIGAIAAFFAMSNRVAHLANLRPNDEFYLLGRVPKEAKADR